MENYSERNGELTINSHIDDEFLKRIEQKKIEEQKKEEQKIIEQKKKEEDEFQKVSNTRDISKIQTFLEDNPNTSFKLEAKNLIDEILLERDLAEKKRQEQEEANRLAEKKKKEQAEAIKLVKEITLEFKNDTFKTAQDVLKPAVEKNKYFEYNEAQKDIIAEQIKRCWENDPKSFKKKTK